MTRRIVAVVALTLMLALACVAQQPDIRLELLTLYTTNEATLHPIDKTQVRACRTCKPETLSQAMRLVAAGDALTGGPTGQRGGRLFVQGGSRIEFGDVTRIVQHPLEVRADSGRLRFTVVLPFDEYVSQVVQGETSGTMPPEALRAMAVAARTYATYFRERHKSGGFDFCDTTHCQFVRAKVSPKVRDAVEQTHGELLWVQGSPIPAYYHKDCGGRTEAAQHAWPTAVSRSESREDPYCVRVTKPWRAELSREQIDAALQRGGIRLPTRWSHIRISRKTPSGRASMLTFSEGASAAGVPVSASTLRFAVGRALGWSLLKSDAFELIPAGDRFVFSGRGVGHGVGLCQTGAIEMARSGKSYREILAFYYPKATVSVAAAGIEWRKVQSSRIKIRVAGEPSSSLARKAESALNWAEARTQLTARGRPALDVYGTVALFRDATGEPGWVAASTRGTTIRVQPEGILGLRFERVVRHEFIHLLLEENANAAAPMWFREGLAIALAGEATADAPRMPPEQIESALQRRADERATQSAHAAAGAIVARLLQQHGRAQLMRWLRDGLPDGALDGLGFAQKSPDNRSGSQPR